MALYDDLLVDGVSLSTGLSVADGVCIEGPWEWPFQSTDHRGDLPVYLGYDGVGFAEQPYNAFTLPIYMTLNVPPCDDGVPPEQSDETWAWINNAIQVVRQACKPDRLVTLTRKRSMPSPDDELDNTSPAKLLRITTSRPGRDTLRLVIEFLLLDGIWHGEEETEVLTPGSNVITVPGDTRTYAIGVTFEPAADSDQMIVTNQTNGFTFQLNQPGAYGGDTFDVDVPARTAVRVIGGAADVSRYLVWSKVHLLRLEPGANTLVVDADTTLTYLPAYL